MDIFTLEAVVAELSDKLPGARINKIHQPTADDIILRLWTGREELRLLLSASPRDSRMHLTDRSYPNPFTPPRFCQLLRSRLSRVIGIEQAEGERVVEILFAGRKGEGYRLVAELLGAGANLVLLDDSGKIVDALRRSRERGIGPGKVYRPPAARELHLLREAPPEVPAGCGGAEAFRKWLLATFSPMSPLIADELAARVEGGLEAGEALEGLRRSYLEKDYLPTVGILRGKTVLSPFALSALPLEEAEVHPSVSAAADAFYYERAFGAGTIGDKKELDSAVRKELKRLASRTEKILEQQKNLEDSDRRRRIGDLLLANLHLLKRGMEEVVLEDFYADPPVPIRIDLDSRLSPQENAERYFKGFKKDKRGVSHVARRLEETRQEILWLEEVALCLDQAEAGGELEAIRRELEEAGLVRKKTEPESRRKQPHPKEQLKKTSSPGGFTLYWGRNNRSNDYLSKELCAPDDLWFHAHNMPGAHLVLKREDSSVAVPEEDILFAASIAAGRSRGKEDSKVEVMVAEGRKVRKIKGGRPGMVTVERYRTVVVKPRVVGEEG